eukprot:s719_g13.t1
MQELARLQEEKSRREEEALATAIAEQEESARLEEERQRQEAAEVRRQEEQAKAEQEILGRRQEEEEALQRARAEEEENARLEEERQRQEEERKRQEEGAVRKALAEEAAEEMRRQEELARLQEEKSRREDRAALENAKAKEAGSTPDRVDTEAGKTRAKMPSPRATSSNDVTPPSGDPKHRFTIEATGSSSEIPLRRQVVPPSSQAVEELSTLQHRPSSVSMTAKVQATRISSPPPQDAATPSDKFQILQRQGMRQVASTVWMAETPRQTLPASVRQVMRSASSPSTAVVAAVAAVAKVKAVQRCKPDQWVPVVPAASDTRIQSLMHMSCDALERQSLQSSTGTLDTPGTATHRMLCQPVAATQSWADLAARARESCQQALQAVASPSPITPRTAWMDRSPRSKSLSRFDGASSPPPRARVEHRFVADPMLPATRTASPMARSPVYDHRNTVWLDTMRSPRPTAQVADLWIQEPRCRTLASPTVTQRREAVLWRPQSPLAAMPTLTSPSETVFPLPEGSGFRYLPGPDVQMQPALSSMKVARSFAFNECAPCNAKRQAEQLPSASSRKRFAIQRRTWSRALWVAPRSESRSERSSFVAL